MGLILPLGTTVSRLAHRLLNSAYRLLGQPWETKRQLRSPLSSSPTHRQPQIERLVVVASHWLTHLVRPIVTPLASKANIPNLGKWPLSTGSIPIIASLTTCL